ncbi:MAG: hypothetical protein DRJ38_10385 [Thermoprotei archaeon]|nr:MAG: hypothetical protein DRJ38_10385 [Thermoprotei archaeon]
MPKTVIIIYPKKADRKIPWNEINKQWSIRKTVSTILTHLKENGVPYLYRAYNEVFDADTLEKLVDKDREWFEEHKRVPEEYIEGYKCYVVFKRGGREEIPCEEIDRYKPGMTMTILGSRFVIEEVVKKPYFTVRSLVYIVPDEEEDPPSNSSDGGLIGYIAALAFIAATTVASWLRQRISGT